MDEVCVERVHLRYSNLSSADLRGANLRNANLSNANLRYSNLSGADLRDANLSNADLRGANLSNADLRGANLRNADLSNADLRGANLSGADLRDADLRGANLPNETWVILGEPYFLSIHQGNLRAGCECHDIEDWRDLDEDEIEGMDGKDALEFYPRLLKIIDFYCGEK